MENNKVRDRGSEEGEIKEYQLRQALAISSVAAKLVNLAIRKLEDYFDAPIEEVLEFLENNPQYLDASILDVELNKLDRVTKLLILSAMKGVGVILKRNDGWRKELLSENGNEFIIQVIKKYLPELYPLVKDKTNIINFLRMYIVHKLGIG